MGYGDKVLANLCLGVYLPSASGYCWC